MTYLPDEIWYMVCAQLWHQRDFDTLFNCACSGKRLAAIAVSYLYRMQYITPVPLYETFMSQRNMRRIWARWVGLWRAIILSTLDKTLYPYSQYIRTLDLQNLTELLRGIESGDRCSHDIFHGELRKFKSEHFGKKSCPFKLNEVRTISRIGESITKRTPLLEELIGTVSSGALTRCIPRLPRLTHLKLGSEEAIESNGAMIRLYCNSFKRLTFYNCDGINSDRDLASFLNELCPQSLESFAHLDFYKDGTECFQALNYHGESLKELKLSMFPSGSFPEVWLLKGCTNLVSLSIGDTWQSTIDLEISNNGPFLEMLAWLKECKKLRTLSFFNFSGGPALMAPILIKNNIKLTSLRYEGSAPRDTENFYKALASQTSLRSLCLKEKKEVHEYAPKADVLIDSLSKLVNLTILHLGQTSQFFSDQHIVQLASRLPKLEDWWTSGYMLTDAIWGEVATLRSLRRLDIAALASFTVNGVLDFIEKLGPGNKGLSLSLMNKDWDTEIALVNQEKIQKIIARKVKGSFNMLWYEGDYWQGCCRSSRTLKSLDCYRYSNACKCGCEDDHWYTRIEI